MIDDAVLAVRSGADAVLYLDSLTPLHVGRPAQHADSNAGVRSITLLHYFFHIYIFYVLYSSFTGWYLEQSNLVAKRIIYLFTVKSYAEYNTNTQKKKL